MTLNDQARAELVAALNTLTRRRANTTDPEEKAAINAAIRTINAQIQELNQADLLGAALQVAAAADALEEVVAKCRVGPFDGYLAAIESAIGRLQAVQGAMHESEGLASADFERGPVDQAAQPASPLQVETGAAMEAGMPSSGAVTTTRAEPGGAQPTTAPGAGDIPVRNSKSFDELRDEYDRCFAACTIKPGVERNIEYYLSRLAKHRPTYEDTGADLGIPWHFIGILHAMESGFNFGTHLHNGDPLTARTVHVPAGRPLVGSPPFTWKESARDALMMHKLHQETDWSIPRQLYLFERWNGLGYRMRGVRSPYLWSFSNLYTAGKFVGDGRFDPTAVSKQCGAAVLLKALLERNLL